MKLLVLGAGAWGTAVAVHAAAAHETTLWARDAAQAQTMQDQRCNAAYLPGVALPVELQVLSGDLAAIASRVDQYDAVIVGTPMAGLRSTLSHLAQAHVPVAWLCKGFEAVTSEAPTGTVGLMGHEVCHAVAPRLQAGVVSGPSFALEVARGQPTALVAASPHTSVQAAMVLALHHGNLRVYANADWIGVEVGGAVKNVLAIATGLCDGLALGLNARAALITRGLAEMARLGAALGAQRDTFMGLSGLGDLVLTATGELSRNRKVGGLLAQGMSLSQAVESLGHVAEGVYSARTVVQRAQSLGVDMPISQAVVALLDGQLTAPEAVQALMRRDPVVER
jgi:glycerol-3-phosphate dehydrogenase (NAD(P)+)